MIFFYFNFSSFLWLLSSHLRDFSLSFFLRRRHSRRLPDGYAGFLFFCRSFFLHFLLHRANNVTLWGFLAPGKLNDSR